MNWFENEKGIDKDLCTHVTYMYEYYNLPFLLDEIEKVLAIVDTQANGVEGEFEWLLQLEFGKRWYLRAWGAIDSSGAENTYTAEWFSQEVANGDSSIRKAVEDGTEYFSKRVRRKLANNADEILRQLKEGKSLAKSERELKKRRAERIFNYLVETGTPSEDVDIMDYEDTVVYLYLVDMFLRDSAEKHGLDGIRLWSGSGNPDAFPGLDDLMPEGE